MNLAAPLARTPRYLTTQDKRKKKRTHVVPEHIADEVVRRKKEGQPWAPVLQWVTDQGVKCTESTVRRCWYRYLDGQGS